MEIEQKFKKKYIYVVDYLATQPKFSFQTCLALSAAIVIMFLWFMALYSSFWGTAETYSHGSTFYLFSLFLVFIFFPTKRESWFEDFSLWFLIDVAIMILIVWLFVYIRWDIEEFMYRGGGMPSGLDRPASIAIAALTLEATRRTVGPGLSVIALVFFLYAGLSDLSFIPSILQVSPMPFERFLDVLFWDTSGIFGIPVSIVSTFIVILLIFGSTMFAAGIGELLTKGAMALTGNMLAGPAKAAVLGSSFFGMLTGSASSNVTVVGTFTIPLMKSIGFRPAIAGAIECCASVGSLVMPPVMGATAFVMAAFMGVTYWKVVLYAITPALLYYLYVFLTVHYEAVKLGIKKEKNETKIKPILIRRGHLLLPIVVLFIAIFSGYSPVKGAFWAIVCTFVVSRFRPESRIRIGAFLLSMERALRSGLVIFTACGAAGFIIASVNVTGIGLRFSEIMLIITGGDLFIGCLVAIFAGLILGLGLTPTVVYITMYALIIPAMIKLGAPVVAAHLMCFYYGLLGELTPPIAISAFTAAAIAGANPMTTSWHATRLGLGLYILPIIFVYHPEILLIGDMFSIVTSIVIATFSIVCLASSFMGVIFRPIGFLLRAILFGVFALMTMNMPYLQIIGVVLGASVILFEWIKVRKKDMNLMEQEGT